MNYCKAFMARECTAQNADERRQCDFSIGMKCLPGCLFFGEGKLCYCVAACEATKEEETPK